MIYVIVALCLVAIVAVDFFWPWDGLGNSRKKKQ